MLKPPFTVIIIKKTHEPRTIQVGTGLILSVFLIFSLICVVTALGISIILARFDIPLLQSTAQVFGVDEIKKSEILIKPLYDDVRGKKDSASTDIENLSITRERKNRTGISFSFKNVNSRDIVYVWLVINPDADTAGETVICPRNPVFRGIPVDYRNGIEHRPSTDNEVRIPLSELISGIDFNTFRILAYSIEGKVLVDRMFDVRQTKGSGTS